jgi:hypothetical protein
MTRVDTIAKLLRLLASDKPGEIIAAVHALRRVLSNAGLDLHDLADTIKSADRRKAGGDENVFEMIRCCYRHADMLTTKELNLVRSISDWSREPNPGHLKALRPIYKRCLERERRR